MTSFPDSKVKWWRTPFDGKGNVTMFQMMDQVVVLEERDMTTDDGRPFPLEEWQAVWTLWRQQREKCGCAQCLEELK